MDEDATATGDDRVTTEDRAPTDERTTTNDLMTDDDRTADDEDGAKADEGGPATVEGRSSTSGAPSFDIPARPTRRYTRSGGVEYEGATAFHLEPDAELSVDELEAVLSDLLVADRYVKGDWFDLPRPVYLVHDREISTVFRVVVRAGRLEFHVLPSTDAAGLRTLYDRLLDATDADWTVACRVDRS